VVVLPVHPTEARKAQRAAMHAVAEFDSDAVGLQILVTKVLVDGAKAIQVTGPCVEQIVAGQSQDRRLGWKPPPIGAVDGIQVLEHAHQARHVFFGAPVDDVHVVREHRRALQNRRHHSHDDELHLRASERVERVRKLRKAH
jgi:hypothetical protein